MLLATHRTSKSFATEVQQLQDQTGAHINVDQETNVKTRTHCTLYLSGTPSQIEHVRRASFGERCVRGLVHPGVLSLALVRDV